MRATPRSIDMGKGATYGGLESERGLCVPWLPKGQRNVYRSKPARGASGCK